MAHATTLISLQDGRGQFVAAELNTTRELIANRAESGVWEAFQLVPLNLFEGAMEGKRRKELRFALRASNGRYVSAPEDKSKPLVADREVIGPWETFKMRVPTNTNDIAIEAWHGGIVSADRERGGLLVANRTEIGAWESFSVTRSPRDIWSTFPLYGHGSDQNSFAIVTTSALCADVPREVDKPGARLALWACRTYLNGQGNSEAVAHQRFHFGDLMEVQTLPGGSKVGGRSYASDVQIKPGHAGSLCLTSHGRDKPVTFETCDTTGLEYRQVWKLHALDGERAKAIADKEAEGAKALAGLQDLSRAVASGSKPPNAFQLRTYDGYCLDVLGGAMVAGKELGVYDCKMYGHNQVFSLHKNLGQVM